MFESGIWPLLSNWESPREISWTEPVPLPARYFGLFILRYKKKKMYAYMAKTDPETEKVSFYQLLKNGNNRRKNNYRKHKFYK